MTTGRLLLTLPLFLVLACGCQKASNAPARLSGKVTHKGDPVMGGQMMFYTKDAGSYPATIGADGTYSVTDLPAGELTVTIETESLNPKGKIDPKDYGGGKAGGKKMTMGPVPEGFATGNRGQYVKIPPKYADKNKSGLTITLVAGAQTHDFDLPD